MNLIKCTNCYKGMYKDASGTMRRCDRCNGMGYYDYDKQPWRDWWKEELQQDKKAAIVFSIADL